MKEIIVAANSGFCFGVKRAVDMALGYHKDDGTRVYTLGPLIHNNDVIRRLESDGIQAIDREQISNLGADDVIVIRSHGIDPSTIEQIRQTQATMVDATCPYVSTIQRKAARHYNQGYTIVIVGDKDHPEVQGINGWCGNSAIVTRDGTDLPPLPDRICIVAQTTEKRANYDRVVDVVSKQCSDVITYNTICSATTERQTSADEVSRQVDLMIVIGGKHSSNTKKLYEISQRNCANTIFIENAADLTYEMINDAQIQKIGITAGASTPNEVIDAVVQKITSAGIKELDRES